MEKWKNIDSTDFRISNFGNMEKFVNNKWEDYKLSKDTKGYNRITINSKTFKIHRLVAYYFISKKIDNLTVNHKDFDKQNNHFSNLEIITLSENTMHYIENKIKLSSSSKVLGVGFHKGINKWTARVNYLGERYSVGTFNTEIEAINAVNSFDGKENLLKKGKGKSSLGKCKYSFLDDINALIEADKNGLTKAGKITGMGSTRINGLRRKYNLKYDIGRYSSRIKEIMQIKEADLFAH